MKLFNKYSITLGILFTLLILFISKIFFNNEKNSEIKVSQSEKNITTSTNNTVEVKNKESTEDKISENINVEAKNNEFENFVNNSTPSSVLEAQQEVEFLEKRLKDENAVERLNNNTVSM